MALLNVFAFLMLGSMLVTGSSANNGSYFIVAPNVIRPGSTVSLKVTIMKADGPVDITAGILEGNYRSRKKLVVETSGTFTAGSTGTLDIQLPSGLKYGSYDMFVNGTGGLQFYKKNYVNFRNKGMSFYVQTDKGIYKPGQTVHMRVFALLPTLQSYMGKMTVDIVDPNNNKMAHLPDLQEPYGLIKKDFKLSTQPVKGNWRISVSGRGEKHDQYFEVKEYVLPKFEVSVTLPPFILKKDSKLQGSVSSKYTYGQDVRGSVELELYFNRWSGQKIKKQLQLTGTTSFDFNMDEIKSLFLRTYKQGYECRLYQSWYTLHVSANVTEGLTGKSAIEDEKLKFYYSDIKLEFPSFNPKNYKPGLQLETVLKVSHHDGKLVAPERLKTMKISVSTMYSKSAQETTETYTPSPEGMIIIRNQIPEDAKDLNIRAEYKHGDDQPVRVWFTASKSQSVTNSYLQLSTTTPTIKSGETIQCKVKSNFPLESYVYMVLSRGKILQMDSKTLQNGEQDAAFSFPSTSAMAPSARIVVYSITNNDFKEVVVDGLTISVENPFDNEVTVDFNKESSRPGDKVELVATATPGSQVAFLAVDKSVLLLNKDNDISRSQVLSDLQSFVSGSGWYPWWDWDWYHPRSTTGAAFHVYGRDAGAVFENSGLVTFTDCLVHRTSRRYPYTYGNRVAMELGGAGGAAGGGGFGVRSFSRKLASVTKVRTFFPETWLWVDVNTSSNGQAQISTTVPDTITSWVASAFAISPVTGFGIGALKPKLKVFQPFFISLDLPYSVIRGEEIAIKALIFNYLKQPQQVTVTFKASKDWKAINAAADQGDYEQDAVDIRKVITVPAGQGKSIAFPIIAKTLGNVPLEVRAQSYAAADAVKRNLLVEPEGIAQHYSYSLLIDLNTTSSFTKTLEVALPNTTVPGSSYVKASVIGDILGSSFNNLGNLLRMPYGCGEQNMLNFAPNIFILKYLTEVDKVTKDIKNKAEIYMEQGYQREQSYRHRDGSYSAFGRIDPEGSMWLTAFVVKSFAQARDYIYIDPMSLSQSLGWIARNQNKDGSFPKVGPVLHGGSLQGGLKGNVSLTAFVTIALAEAGNNSKVITAAKEKAVRYLESNLDKIIKIKDVYSLAITTYALRLVESDMSGTALSALLARGIRKAGTMYWSNEKPDPVRDRASPFVPYYRPRSADIEITAYTLLTLSLDNDIVNGLPVVRWLSQQRNALGGYASTQDTVLGIQAMAEFASFIYSPLKSFKVELTHSEDKTFSKTFRIDNNNDMVLQQVVIPKVTGSIKVSANGHGFGLLQIGVSYHVTKEPVNSNFDFVVKVLKEEDNKIEIKACAQYLGKEESSNMAVMEIGVASGFSPDKEALDKLLRNKKLFLKRTESEDKKLILYFDKIKKENATCVTIGFERTHAVGKGQPIPAVVYDYYNPENRAQVLYMVNKLKDISVCSICPSCVNCNHKNSP